MLTTNVMVSKEDWLILAAYDALADAAGLIPKVLLMQLDGEVGLIEVHAREDMEDCLAQRHGLPRLPAGGYEIDYDNREYVVDRRNWRDWVQNNGR